MGKRIDLTGQTINGIKVVDFAYAGGGKSKKAYWNCVCFCGNEFVVESLKLRSGHTRSCGCLHRKMIGDLRRTHGATSSGGKKKLYLKWKSIRSRCNNKNSKRYKDYGGRGIKVCEEWNDYPEFENWALRNGYKEGLSIERIDVNGDYCPENCKWIPLKEQCLNKRDTVWVEYKGQRKQLKVWCEELGLNYGKVAQRLKPMGWSVERAFETP